MAESVFGEAERLGWGMACVAVQAFVAGESSKWGMARATVCRLSDLELAVGCGPLVHWGRPGNRGEAGRWLLVASQAELVAEALPQTFGGTGIWCRTSHYGVVSNMAAGGPVVSLSLIGADEFETEAEADSWTRSACDCVASWLAAQGLRTDGFKMDGNATEAEARVHFEQAGELGRAWAVSDQLQAATPAQAVKDGLGKRGRI